MQVRQPPLDTLEIYQRIRPTPFNGGQIRLEEDIAISALMRDFDHVQILDNEPVYVATYLLDNGKVRFTTSEGEGEVYQSKWTPSSILYNGQPTPCFLYVSLN